MNSLFTRIFLGVFFAMTLAGAGFALVYAIETPSDPRHRGRLFLEDALRARGAVVLDQVARGDERRARADLDALDAHTHARVYVFADDGRVLGPGQASASTRELVGGVRQSGRASHRDGIGDGVFVAAVPIDGGVVAAELPRPRRPDSIFGALETLPIRFAIALLAVALVATLLARYLTRPLEALREATDRLASGDLDVRVAPRVGDAPAEIAALAHDFDRMAGQIASLLESKERLLRDVSHELRSPLARLSLALGLARQRSGDGPQPELDRIEREAERLGELVGHILTLARLADANPLAASRIELMQLVEGIVKDANYEATAEGKQVHVIDRADVVVEANPEALRWAIENVVRNAVAYSPRDGAVEVSVVREDDEVRIRVRDRGPGVPPDSLEAIFLPFHRVGTDRDRRTGGAGVGLAIAHRVATRTGGGIAARNLEGGGTEVTLRLPVARDSLPSERSRP